MELVDYNKGNITCENEKSSFEDLDRPSVIFEWRSINFRIPVKITFSSDLGPSRVDTKGNFNVDLGDTAGTYAMRVRASDAAKLMYVKSDGKVGIGTESPTHWLDVIGDSSIWPIILMSGASSHGTGIEFYNGASGGGSTDRPSPSGTGSPQSHWAGCAGRSSAAVGSPPRPSSLWL